MPKEGYLSECLFPWLASLSVYFPGLVGKTVWITITPVFIWVMSCRQTKRSKNKYFFHRTVLLTSITNTALSVWIQVSFVWFSLHLQIKTNEVFQLTALVTDQHSVDKNMAVIILSSHTHAIVFWLRKVGGGQQLCEIACEVCHPESD